MEKKHGSKKIVDAILSRRSIRKFKPEKVDRKIINELLEVGRSAPSRGNSQPWHFVLVTDDKTKKDLADACYGQELVEEAAFCIVVLGKIDPREDVPDRTAELVEAGAFGQEVK
ncbi:Nitroreductase [Candidatus Methanophagaceae archaeon]|nr:Nitroreductase [Methanophagales archaeon]